MIHTFIISHERIFPIEKELQSITSGTKKLLSMEEAVRFIPKIRAGLVKEKKIRFISIQNNGMEVE
jgi:hypothetical protein